MSKGAAPIPRGIGAPSIERLRATLAERGITSTRSATGWSGYDMADKYALEMPEMLVGTIFGACFVIERREP